MGKALPHGSVVRQHSLLGYGCETKLPTSGKSGSEREGQSCHPSLIKSHLHLPRCSPLGPLQVFSIFSGTTL